MKKFKFVLAMLIAMSGLLSSCVKEDDTVDEKPWEIDVPIVDYEPGKMPGLGNEGGDPTGPSYDLPDGFELDGPVVGFDGVITRADQVERVVVGSGTGLVRLIVKLNNTLNKSNSIVFPAGLILKPHTNNKQKGVLIKKTREITFKPFEKKEIVLDMYCANSSKGSSNSSVMYDFFVITDASPIWELINFVKDRVINWEELPLYSLGAEYYKPLVSKLQHIVWQLTDSGHHLSDANRNEILENTIEATVK